MTTNTERLLTDPHRNPRAKAPYDQRPTRNLPTHNETGRRPIDTPGPAFTPGLPPAALNAPNPPEAAT